MILEATLDGRRVSVEVRKERDGYAVLLDGRRLALDARRGGPGTMSLILDGRSHAPLLERRAGGYTVHLREDTFEVELAEASRGGGPGVRRGPAGPLRLTAPMPGRLVRVLVEPGQQVEAGQGLVVMEAMKMENELRAVRAGRVAEVHARERQAVETGALLVVLD
ncbi:MAG TPA: biotin/lipoyl-containing protein [Vicinamibacteria bacterium]|jgi:biotin carboxyl carrier protein